MPSVLEIISYVWFCQSAGLGVFIEFSDYKKFIERRFEYSHVPNPIVFSLQWLFASLSFLGLFILASPYFYIELCYTKEFEEQYSFAYRIFYWHVSMSLKRFYYYNPFCLSTGAIVACGLGYNGIENGHHKWNKVVGVYWKELEMSTSPVEMIRHWNH